MKKSVLTAAFALLFTVAGFAQRAEKAPKTPEQRAEKMTQRMQQELSLNAEQTKRVQELNLEFARHTAEVRAAEAAARKARHEKMKPFHERHEAQLKEILTPEQYSKREELVKERKAKMKEHKRGKGKGKGLQHAPGQLKKK